MVGQKLHPGRFCGERIIYDWLFGFTIGACFFGFRRIKARYLKKGRAGFKVKDFYMKKYKLFRRPTRLARWIAGLGAANCIPTLFNGGNPVSLIHRHFFYFVWGFVWVRRKFGAKSRYPTLPIWIRIKSGLRWWRFMLILEILFYFVLGALHPEHFPSIHNLFPAGTIPEVGYFPEEDFEDDSILPYRFQDYGSTLTPGVHRNYAGGANELITKFKRMQLYHLPQFDTKGSLPEPFDPNKVNHLLSDFVRWRGNEKKIRQQQYQHEYEGWKDRKNNYMAAVYEPEQKEEEGYKRLPGRR